MSLSEEEQAYRVSKLQERLKSQDAWDDSKHDVYALRRFLRARAWNPHEAEKMWVAMMAWRKEWQVDSMLDHRVLSEDRQRRLIQVFPHGLHGVDNKGRPILIYHMGSIDLDAVTREFSEKTLQKHHIQMYEFIMRVALPACSLAAGRHIDQVTNIFDLKGVGFWALSKLRALFVPMMSITRDNYPETLGQVLVINAPVFFDSTYAVAKVMLSAETQAKIQVVGKSYQTVLDRYICRTQLPPNLGGKSDAKLGDNWGPWSKLLLQHLRQSRDGGGCAPARRGSRKGSIGNEASTLIADGCAPGLSTTSQQQLTPGSVHDRPSAGPHGHAGSAERLWSACAAAVGCMGVVGAASGVSQPHAGENGGAERLGRRSGPGSAEAQGQGLPSSLAVGLAPGDESVARESQSQSVYTAAADGASAGTSFAGDTGNGIAPSGASGSVGSVHAQAPGHALTLPGPPNMLGGRGEAGVSVGAGASPTTPFPVLTSPFRAAAAFVPDSIAGGNVGPGGGGGAGLQGDLDTVSEQVLLQGHSSIASFHTCLSVAESSALTSYLQHPSLGGFGMSHAAGPAALASPGRPSQPTIINEEDHHGSASPGPRGGASSSTDGRSQGSRRTGTSCLACFGRRPREAQEQRSVSRAQSPV